MLVIAGGGGGGNGGGGAGGYCATGGSPTCGLGATFSFSSGSTGVTIGNGGAGDSNGGTTTQGANGQKSVFSSVTSTGGGGGAGINQNVNGSPPGNGGSGGGGGLRSQGALMAAVLVVREIMVELPHHQHLHSVPLAAVVRVPLAIQMFQNQ